MMIVRRFGAPRSLNSAITATGSVAEIRQPKMSADSSGNGVSRWMSVPMSAVESSRPGAASVMDGMTFRMSTGTSMLKADSKIKMGMNRNMIITGPSLSCSSAASTPGMSSATKATATPTTTSPTV